MFSSHAVTAFPIAADYERNVGIVDLICGPLYFHHVGKDVCPVAEKMEASETELEVKDGSVAGTRRKRTLVSDECNQLCREVCLAASGECVKTSSKRVNCVCKMEQS